MSSKRFVRDEKQCIIYTDDKICNSKRAVLHSDLFENMVELFVRELSHRNPSLLSEIGLDLAAKSGLRQLLNILRALDEHSMEQLISILPAADIFLEQGQRTALHEFVEQLYDYWRSRDRYMVLLAKPGSGNCRGQRPHRSFNDTLISLGHHIRSLYRNVCENITGGHPRTYRHVGAGCKVGLIAVSCHFELPPFYDMLLGKTPLVRQVWLTPPMILNSSANVCSGQFQRTDRNPLHGLVLQQGEWLCYPAQVGSVVIFIYFHQQAIGLGSSLANLFELASDTQITAGPDAVYLFGLPPQHMQQFGDSSAVFFDDLENELLVAAIPFEDRFDSFACLKNMAFALHNIIMIARGRMPFHGSLATTRCKKENSQTVLLIGNRGTEILEAMRSLGFGRVVTEMNIIADDTGSLKINDDGSVAGYGTGIGAFLRLDTLQGDDAFKQMDRAIIMNPHTPNGQVLLPTNTIEEVLKGHGIDLLLFVSDFEEGDASHPPVEMLDDSEQALRVFSAVHNCFPAFAGMQQYEKFNEELAGNTFQAALQSGCKIVQLRTGMSIPDDESLARTVIELIESDT